MIGFNELFSFFGTTIRSDVRDQQVLDYSVVRIAQGVTHFSPGSYDSMPTCETPIPNMFMSGDWIVNEHGSFSQGKVVGLPEQPRKLCFVSISRLIMPSTVRLTWRLPEF